MSKRFNFSSEEYQRLATVSDKLYRSRIKLSDKEWKRGNNPIVKEIYKIFSLHVKPVESHIVFLKRTHLRYLEEHCTQAIKVLDERIIPTYKERGEKEYEDYIRKAVSDSDTYKGILDKIRKAL